MAKLKKHVPESRSAKRERIAEQERQNHKEDLVRAQQVQIEDVQTRLWREWHSIQFHRLDSEEAYARFEAFFRQQDNRPDNWRTDNPEPLIAIWRHRDGKSVEPEVVLTALEQEPNASPQLLIIAKQLAFKGIWSDAQLKRLQDVVIRHLSFHRWHKRALPLVRLARAITNEFFEARVGLLLQRQEVNKEMVAWVLAHLEQENTMRVK